MMRAREKQLRAASHKTTFLTGPKYTLIRVLLLLNTLFTWFALKAAAAA
jgi:hypothetical protein